MLVMSHLKKYQTIWNKHKHHLKRSSIVDKNTGRVDLRYNPLSIDEDYFIPVRGGDTGTKIEPLAVKQLQEKQQDVEYIQKKLICCT